MARRRPRTNPFYVLLVAIGIAFTITACVYFVMALRESGVAGTRIPIATVGEGQSPQALLDFMDRHGVQLLVAELALLAVATCGAIGTDHWWSTGNPRNPVGEELAGDKTRRA